jgi:uncharacterized membrane protein YkvA (DUF1232 family)
MAKSKRQTSHEPDLLARFWNELVLAVRLLLDRRVGGTAKLIPVAILLYILSPLDLIPDVFLPFGVVDDITALLIGLQLFIHSAPPDVVAGYRQRGKRQPSDDVTVIEGEYTVRKDKN